MLVFFKPDGWRTGEDIVAGHDSWEAAFDATEFSEASVKIMKNMNVLYECLDARDDYSALRRQQEQSQGISLWSESSMTDTNDAVADTFASTQDMSIEMTTSDNTIASILDDPVGPVGSFVTHVNSKIDLTISIVNRIYGEHCECTNTALPATTINLPSCSPTAWHELLLGAKSLAVNARRELLRQSDTLIPVDHPSVLKRTTANFDPDLVSIITNAFFTPKPNVPHPLQDVHLKHVHDTATTFTLNSEQLLAFCIIARHLHHHEKKPLRMYLGGIGGTGKSTVVRALIHFLTARNEAHRFLVLAPTGSSACNINGQTYHSALGIN